MLCRHVQSRSGYLAIRGSVLLKLGRVSDAMADYEAAVTERVEQGDLASSQGEAWVELGWEHLRALQVTKARYALQHGLDLMRQDFQRNPALRPDFLIRALMKHALAFALMLDFKKARMRAQEGCRLARERVASDQLSGIRGRCAIGLRDSEQSSRRRSIAKCGTPDERGLLFPVY